MSEMHPEPILVNGEEVNGSLLEQELHVLCERYAQHMSRKEMEAQSEKIESDARENAVERVLLLQQARSEITDLSPGEVDARFHALRQEHGGGEAFDLEQHEIDAIKAEIEDSVRLEKYFDLICRDVPRPVGDDSQAYYDAHMDEFKVPEQVRAAHIVKQPSPEKSVEQVYADLLNIRENLIRGADFDEMASEHSDCSDGHHDLGFFVRGQMVESFEKVAFSIQPGEISDVFQSEFGYHILKVIECRPERIRPYEEIRYDIEAMLYDERKNDAIGAVADQLRARADIRNLVIAG